MYHDSLSPHRVNYFEKDRSKIRNDYNNDKSGMKKRRAAELADNYSKMSQS